MIVIIYNITEREKVAKYTFITLAPASYLRSLVVKAVHRHRAGVPPAGIERTPVRCRCTALTTKPRR